MKYITIHNTDNYSKGANAKAHANYLKNVNNKVSWHYTVDDTEVYHHLPDNEAGYHTGDGMGIKSGNLNSIGVEICVNSDGDLRKATDNAVELVKKLMKKHNIPIENVVQHNYWSGKNCPRELRNGNPYSWEEFIKKVSDTTMGEVRYKTVQEMPDWAKEPIQGLIDKGILSGRGGEAGLDLSDDMVRVLILAKKIFEEG